jgi:hypothetical protein
MNDNEQLVQDMRDCASLLRQFATEESYSLDKVASATAPASTARAEYMDGLLAGFALED